jgi:PTH1 family peptidyl-tRNA hydrolase
MLSLVLGLGNAGDRYRSSRHNLGFRVIERLLKANRLKLQPGPDEFDFATKGAKSAKIVFAVPKTYMNRSGIAARVLLQHYQLDPLLMLVIVDDLHLPLGRIRIRSSGSDGGHNGLASIMEELGTEDFPRLRLGIGPLPEGVDQTDFVFGDFEQSEIETVEEMIARACQAVTFYLNHGLDQTQSEYNQNPA